MNDTISKWDSFFGKDVWKTAPTLTDKEKLLLFILDERRNINLNKYAILTRINQTEIFCSKAERKLEELEKQTDEFRSVNAGLQMRVASLESSAREAEKYICELSERTRELEDSTYKQECIDDSEFQEMQRMENHAVHDSLNEIRTELGQDHCAIQEILKRLDKIEDAVSMEDRVTSSDVLNRLTALEQAFAIRDSRITNDKIQSICNCCRGNGLYAKSYRLSNPPKPILEKCELCDGTGFVLYR